MAATLNPAQQKLQKQFMSFTQFRLFAMLKLPMAWLSGLRIRELTADKCTVSVPYKWLTQNPFRSTYFACQAMAAEMSTGAPALLAITGQKPSLSMLVVKLEASYSKKATARAYFTCENVAEIFDAVERAKTTGEGQEVTALSIGRTKSGEEVARFRITWSFKARNSD